MQVRVVFEPLDPRVVRLIAEHRFEVRPGREVPARAGEDRHADVVVCVDVGPRVGHAGEHLQVERVFGLGPVHRDGRDVAALFEEQERFVRHPRK